MVNHHPPNRLGQRIGDPEVEHTGFSNHTPPSSRDLMRTTESGSADDYRQDLAAESETFHDQSRSRAEIEMKANGAALPSRTGRNNGGGTLEREGYRAARPCQALDGRMLALQPANSCSRNYRWRGNGWQGAPWSAW